MGDLTFITSIFFFWLKMVVVFSAVLALTRWSPGTPPNYCHWKLACMTFFTFGLAFVSGFLPALPITVSIGEPDLASDYFLFYHKIRSISLPNHVFFIASAMYVVPVFFLFLRHQIDFFQSWELVDRAHLLSEKEKTKLLNALYGYDIKLRVTFKESSALASPVVWGTKPVIVLPTHWREWGNDRLRRVLLHELAHIRRNDWLLRNALRYLRAVFWLVPPVWRMVRRSELYAEYACDDAVIMLGESRSGYADDLIALSSKPNRFNSMVAISSSGFAERIHMVLEGGRFRMSPSWQVKVGVVLSAFIAIAAVFCLTIQFVFQANFKNLSFYEYRLDRQVQIFPSDAEINQATEVMASDVTGENDKLTKLTRPTNYRLVKKGFDFTRLVEEGVRVKVDVNAALKKPRSDRYYEVVSEAFVYPEYPEKALARGIEGEVEALFDIGGDGRVNNIRLNASKKSLKHFADSIKHSLTQSRFYPAEVNGQPMPYLNVKEVFVFRIDNNQK